MKRHVSGLLSIVLLGFLVVSQPANAQGQKNGGTVCLMSSVGKKFELRKVGITVFGNEQKYISIADWKIDEQVYQKVKSLLGKRFSVKKIEFSEKVLEAAFDGTFGAFRDLAAQRRKVLGKKVTSTKCTLLLTILPGSSQFNSTNQYVSGLGLVDTDSIFGGSRLVYALSYLELFNARTMESLGRTSGQIKEGIQLFTPIKGPYVEVKAGPKMPPKAFATNPQTRKVVWTFLDRSLDKSVPGLFNRLRRKRR